MKPIIPVMRTALEQIQELHTKRKIVDGRSYAVFCDNCKFNWPCPTRKLADEGLGGGERGDLPMP